MLAEANPVTSFTKIMRESGRLIALVFNHLDVFIDVGI
jgi:hypothetical protein